MDRGANGGILGNDANVILQHQREVDVTGIDNHELSALKMVDASALLQSQLGPIIGIFKQYAYHGVGRTIHSAGQFEWYKNIVDDKSMKVGGKQYIKTNDGYAIPIDIINGLPYIKMQPNTDKQFEELPHVIFTSGAEWDPTVLDNIISDQEDWYTNIKDLNEGLIVTPFDERGNYKHREPQPEIVILPDPNEPEDLEVNLHRIFEAASNLNQVYVLLHDTEDGIKIEADKYIELEPKRIDYNKYRPYFLHVPLEKIRQTFRRTTQNAVSVVAGRNIIQSIKSPFPAHNVYRRSEPVATDTIFAQVAAIDTNGQTMAQIFVGRKSLVVDVYGMGTEAEFVNTLEDQIRKRGAMDKLISDSAKVEISARVKDILRALCIDDWQSEPEYQHQNFAEHRWKHVKRNVNWVMNWRNVPAELWLQCMKWVADVMNHTSEKSLKWRTPMEVLTGQTTDISILLCFMFYDVVYVSRYEDADYRNQVGSKKSNEIRGHFVGFAWDVGHALTFEVLTDDTRKIIKRSRLRLGTDGENNLKLDIESGEVPSRIYIQSKRDDDENLVLPTIDVSTNPFTVEFLDDDQGEPNQGETKEGEPNHTDFSPLDHPLRDQPIVETVDDDDEENVAEHIRNAGKPGTVERPRDFSAENLDTPRETIKGLSPEQMLQRTFLMPAQEDGTRLRAKIIDLVEEHKQGAQKHPEMAKFRCLVNGEYEDVVAYNDIVNFIEQDDGYEGMWRLKNILEHSKPLTSKHKDYKGSQYNVLVEWETGEHTWEPLSQVWKDDRVTVAIYAAKHKLLDTPGWKFPGLKKLAKTQQRLVRHANQAKLHSFRTKPVYMYGFLVPRNHDQAMEIDARNGNTKWRDAERIELDQLHEYETFVDKGRGHNPGPDWKKIRCHLVYAVKHDGRHKARLVAGGHLTDTPIDSVYSSVVSLRGIRIITFIAELNNLEVWATDIGNAYLESYTQEKVYIIAGSEFGDLAGHTLLISKALYGLKSSGLRWHERFADVLRDMGFFPSKAEQDIWMRDKGDHYEYIAVYVDDLLIASKTPKVITDILMEVHKFKLKGTGPVEFHLGCDFFRDEEGILCYAPRKYIEKMLDNYRRIFGVLPRKAHSPLAKGDHPELDSSELLDPDNIKIYQSLIGALQWCIQIGRWDLTTPVMTLSRFRACPRQGHLDRVKRIHGYLIKYKHGIIRIRTDEPDYSDIPDKVYPWDYSVYAGAKEEIPTDAPKPLGKPIVLTHFVDANLYHDLISGRSVTGIIHMWNKTVIDTYSKLQNTVETSTFGSEYVSTRTCTDQGIDLRITARYLGVPIKGSSYMFGDNESVVNTASIPFSKLAKRHVALSYHRTKECIAAGIFKYYHVLSGNNPADILTKHWDMPSVWQSLKPLMFHQYEDKITEETDES